VISLICDRRLILPKTQTASLYFSDACCIAKERTMNRLIIARLIVGGLLVEAASLGAALDLVLAIVAWPSSRVGACMNG
jgi:hypothetical protein